MRTLAVSVALSAPGPLILGFGLLLGRSSTQISDFTRRTAELFALVVSLAIYAVTNRNGGMEAGRKAALERRSNIFVGIIMCISGASMLLMTFLSGSDDKGNVILALVIAFLGVVANVIFWRRYTMLYRREGNSILGVQARLYRAKSLVDTCVTTALFAVMAAPGSAASAYLDIAGSILVSAYMIYSGVKTIREQRLRA